MMHSTTGIAKSPPSTPKSKVMPIMDTGINLNDVEKGETMMTHDSGAPPTRTTATKKRRLVVVASLLLMFAIVGVLAGVLSSNNSGRTLIPTESKDTTQVSSSSSEDCGGEDCNKKKGFFCKFPIGNCGQSPGGEECVQIPIFCTLQYDPVCGCDGVTYGNACGAYSAAMSIRFLGECSGETISTSTATCNDDSDCEQSEFCKFATGECEFTPGRSSGQCTVKPEGCGAIYEPVCGCDGQTHSNECVAHAAGVSILAQGACIDPDDTIVCSNDNDCEEKEGSFCQFEEGTCGADNATGKCVVPPDICTADWTPVCGCDEKTYGNECMAASAGVSVAAQGECEKNRDDQTCDSCEGGDCILVFPEFDCGASSEGDCEPRPEACPRIDAPVCGCDGVTYPNECEARKGGVSVASLGACPGNRLLNGSACNSCEGGNCILVFPESDCGASSAGDCESRPEACGRIEAEVCGCDGVTYFNECEARKEGGVSVASLGPCPP